jgi:hypothetical protein
MTTYQEEQHSSDKLIVQVSEENPESTKLVPAFEEGIQKLKLVNDEVEKIRQLQEKDISGVTENKHFTIDKLNESTFDISGAVYSYADAKGDLVLKGLVNYSKTQLTKMVPGVLISAANTVLQEAKKLLPADLTKYGISAAELKDHEDLVTYFMPVSESTRGAIIDRTGYTKRLAELFEQSSLLRQNTLDSLGRQFKKKAPAFYTLYRGARKIIHQGPDHTDTPDTPPKP